MMHRNKYSISDNVNIKEDPKFERKKKKKKKDDVVEEENILDL